MRSLPFPFPFPFPFALALASVVAAAPVAACGSHLPRPRPGPPQPADVFVEVDYPPPPARVELVPPAPSKTAVWIDGQWTHGRRWSWQSGGWVQPGPRMVFCPWVTVRRADGALLFAPSAWRDERGEVVPAPPMLVRARPGDPSAPVPRDEPDTSGDAGADGAVDAGAAAPAAPPAPAPTP